MPIAVTWSPRPQPLRPCAAWARGEAARRLARRLLATNDETLERLRGVAGSDLLLVLGDEENLPWVDGIGYLGTSAEATALLLPTQLAPSVPEDLFERAVLARTEPGASPVAVLAFSRTITGPTLRCVGLPPGGRCVGLPPGGRVSAAAARPLARDRLIAWLERSEER